MLDKGLAEPGCRRCQSRQLPRDEDGVHAADLRRVEIRTMQPVVIVVVVIVVLLDIVKVLLCRGFATLFLLSTSSHMIPAQRF